MEYKSVENLLTRVEYLEGRLAEAEQLIHAIKNGEVDAFAITNNDVQEVYTLQTVDYAYRVLVENFNEGALNLTEDGLIVYTNSYFHKTLGLTYENVLGTYLSEYVSDETKETFRLLLQKANNGNSKGEISLNANGRIINVYVSLTSLQPQLDTIGVIMTDLTEKKRSEKLIHSYQGELIEINKLLSNKNKQLEQQILNEFSESFSEYATGKDFFNALTQSLASKTLLDYSFIGELETKSGIPYIKTISFNAFGRNVENISYPLADGACEEVINGSNFIFAARGREQFPKSQLFEKFEVDGYIGHPLYDSAKNPIGVIAVMHRNKIDDVSYCESLINIAARRAELEMERLRSEKILAGKNQELVNQNAELASFSYIASHDLQEPLRKIQAFSSRILQKESEMLSPSGKDYFKRITNAAARMQLLIQSLLTYSRTNTSEIVYETVSLNDTLEEVRRELQDEIQANKVLIDVGQLPVVKAIPHQLRQLLINIISNAIKYRKENTIPVIKIYCDIVSGKDLQSIIQEPKSKYWKVSIEDNGIGFEKQHELKVFELFQRLHTPAEYAGTGIGLAICKKIMQNHKGAITAEGRPGAGATFNIYMPVGE